MSITTGFLFYSALFRLAIILVGALSILLGYFLFIKDPVGQGKTTASLEKGGFKLTLKNFWPGIYFALFGTIIVGLMLWQGNPQLLMQELDTMETTAGSEGHSTKSTRTTQIRGECRDIDTCWKYLSEPRSTLGESAQHISQIGELWQNEGRNREALAMARLAARISPDSPAFLARLARLFLANDEPEKALKAMESAAALDGQYSPDLAALRSRLH